MALILRRVAAARGGYSQGMAKAASREVLLWSASVDVPQPAATLLPTRATRRSLSTAPTASTRQTLVILGTGWSSYSVLKNIDKQLYDVIVISPRNHFLFTPLLCSTTVGTLEFRSIIEPVRNTRFRRSDHFHLAEALKLDLAGKTVHCSNVLNADVTYDVGFDKLVIGVGARPNTFGVPGVTEHAFFLKEIKDARKIRNQILTNFELASEPGIEDGERHRLNHVVIVGGGPTGVEFGAELYDFVIQDVTRLYRTPKAKVRVTLVEANSILSAFDTRLQQYAEKKIRQRDGFELIKSTVSEVTARSVRLSDGTVIPCGLVVWSAGIAPRPFTQSLPFLKRRGQLLTDRHLRVIDGETKDVFAIGDCADIEDMPLPCTAQVAERKGRYLAGYLNGKTTEPFKFQSMGMLAYIGDFKAVGDTPILKTQGFSSWVLWRSAYLTRLGSWRLRLQVPLDWLKTLLFGRDTSRF